MGSLKRIFGAIVYIPICCGVDIRIHADNNGIIWIMEWAQELLCSCRPRPVWCESLSFHRSCIKILAYQNTLNISAIVVISAPPPLHDSIFFSLSFMWPLYKKCRLLYINRLPVHRTKYFDRLKKIVRIS